MTCSLWQGNIFLVNGFDSNELLFAAAITIPWFHININEFDLVIVFYWHQRVGCSGSPDMREGWIFWCSVLFCSCLWLRSFTELFDGGFTGSFDFWYFCLSATVNIQLTINKERISLHNGQTKQKSNSQICSAQLKLMSSRKSIHARSHCRNAS